MNPIASFLVPVFNEEKYLRKCIDSLLIQTEPNFEIVIIDDGSTDGTSEILKTYHDSRIRIYRQENEGRVAARNKALKLSRGKYIILQDADDWSESDRLKSQLEMAESCDGNSVVGTAIFYHREGRDTVRTIRFAESNKDIRRIMSRLVCRQQFHPPTMLALRQTIVDIGGWRLKFDLTGEDGDLLSQLFEDDQIIFHNTSKPLYHYRHNLGSITNKLNKTIPAQMFMRYCERARRNCLSEPDDFDEYVSLMNNTFSKKMKFKTEYLLRCFYGYCKWY
jgi:glycosyltransferase involved in cell wall biosynthesis